MPARRSFLRNQNRSGRLSRYAGARPLDRIRCRRFLGREMSTSQKIAEVADVEPESLLRQDVLRIFPRTLGS
ncbi:hypothetical protein CBM2625_U70004 [Cupriavidus taiwanensis]|nr:hypothetical protein CBM2614_U40017 [Cupriavidus taiwanensis]SPA12938.1 hypothetical protein CBM2625_U70004 [Cupriavidus taiwanensis]